MALRNAAPLFCLVALVAGAAPAHAATYRNQEYGFRVSYPSRLSTCDPGVHNTGVIVSLDGDPACRDDNPHMNVGAAYNVGAPRHNLTELAACDRESDDKTATVVPAPGFSMLGTRRAAACRVDYPNGWIDITLYAMSSERVQDDDGDRGTVPRVIYHGWLHTSRDRLERDLPLFRAMLTTMRFSKVRSAAWGSPGAYDFSK